MQFRAIDTHRKAKREETKNMECEFFACLLLHKCIVCLRTSFSLYLQFVVELNAALGSDGALVGQDSRSIHGA